MISAASPSPSHPKLTRKLVHSRQARAVSLLLACPLVFISCPSSLRHAPSMFNQPTLNDPQPINHGILEVTASTNPDVGLTLKATGHLIPEFDIGLTAFGGVASSTVFVKLDASTAFTIATSTADITQACASASTTLNVGVGAQASFFNLFDASVVETLFNQNFPLLQVSMTTSVPLFALRSE